MSKRKLLALLLHFILLLLFVACDISDYNKTILNPQKNEDVQTSTTEITSPEDDALMNTDIDAQEKNGQIAIDELPYQEEEDKIILRVGFFEAPVEVYYFSVSQNGILEASFGNAYENSKQELHNFDDDLVDMLGFVEESSTKQLTKIELEHLIEMANEIEKNAGSPGWEWNTRFGGWNIFLNYNDVLYRLTYYETKIAVIECFMEQLLILSPIQKPDFWEGHMEYLNERGLKVDRWKKNR